MNALIEVVQYDKQAIFDVGNTLLDGLYIRSLVSRGTFQTGAVIFKRAVDCELAQEVSITDSGLNVVFSGFLSPEPIEFGDEVLLSPPDPFFTIFDEGEREEIDAATSGILEEIAIIHAAKIGADPKRAILSRSVFAKNVEVFLAPILDNN